MCAKVDATHMETKNIAALEPYAQNQDNLVSATFTESIRQNNQLTNGLFRLIVRTNAECTYVCVNECAVCGVETTRKGEHTVCTERYINTH